MENTSENKEKNTKRQITEHLSIGLLAHVDAGKTTLSEAVLYLTGSIRRLGRVDNRDAFLDTYEQERARGITIFSKQAVFPLGDKSVTLLDTPGHVDFSAEMERTLQVLDYGILVISGPDGVQSHTETLWRLLKRWEIPVFVFINKMDLAGADAGAIMEELKSRLDENCVDFTQGKEALWENLALCDEGVLEKYLAEGRVERAQAARLIRERKVFPCFFGSALKLFGVEEFLQGLGAYMDSRPGGEAFGARVFKISRDNQGNRLTHMKITGGSLRVKDVLPGESQEKVNQIRIYSGSRYETVNEAFAGEVCAVAGPSATYPGQGIGTEKEGERPVLEPVLTYRMILPEDWDAPRMLEKLRQLEEEEPELHIVWDEELGEIQVQLMGQVQIEVLRELIRERFGAEVSFDTGNIVYKETIKNTVEGVGHFEPLRHYAEVHLLLEPGERDSGLQFETACSEDALDRNWQRLILTHLEEREHRGVLVGAPITDMKITLLAGRAHAKHTEGGDFRQATYRALRQGLMEAESQLLEPFYSFRLEVPEGSLGRAMADIDRMQGSFAEPERRGDMCILTGRAPVVNMQDYQLEVASYTRGRGRISLEVAGYWPCHNQEEVVAAAGYDPEADVENPSGSVFCSHGAGYFVPWDEVKEHMHVESPWKKQKGSDSRESVGAGMLSSGREAGAVRGEAPAGPAPGRGPSGKTPAAGGSFTGSSWADDKELEAIFVRTFGEIKPRTVSSDGPRQMTYGENAKKKGEPEEEEEYLLVDGYNIIFAWDELRELSKITIDGARQKLMDILCNYQAYRKCTLILVFDAYKVTGNTGEALDYHNIHVVYTKEAETADQYIEKLAHRIGRRNRVTVATSDGLEQLIIYGQGCLLMSARDLKEDIERVRRLIREEQEKFGPPGKNYLFESVDEELAEYLDEVRLGKRATEPRANDKEEPYE